MFLGDWNLQATLFLTNLNILGGKKLPPNKNKLVGPKLTYLTNQAQLNITCPELGTAKLKLAFIYFFWLKIIVEILFGIKTFWKMDLRFSESCFELS